ISSFSPTTVHGGALNDRLNNVLTINGSGFGGIPSGNCAVLFKDANNNRVTPDYEVPYNSSYINSWSDTKIVVKVPDRAATGDIAVVLKSGTTVQSSSPLTVFYSILNAEFDFHPQDIDTIVNAEQRLMNVNGNGGYTIQYSTSTAGGGKNFDASPAKETFLRALATWKDAVGVNFIEGSSTSVQKVTDDQINLIVFDNNNTGVPPMAAGVLESTYSYATVCYNSSPFKVFTAQKTGFDILLRNNGVSVGSIPFEDGPCFPASGTYDREMIVLHELGHGLNLAHINDGAEGTSIPNVNPSKLMHYSIVDYVDRRSLDASAYQGGLYTTTAQKNNYANCSSFTGEMTQLSYTVIPTDDCPASFPTTATADGTVVNLDLLHTTSNKFIDPQFTAVNCNSTGTQVTNNAYYAFRTNSTGNGTLNITVTDYTTTPPKLSSCADQGIRIAVYDVNACPAGQNYPQPLSCATFNTDGIVSGITGLEPDHSYLLYFDGIRNTKATFNVIFNSTGEPPPITGTISLAPNPVKDFLTISLKGTNAGKYQFLVYDILGRLVISQPKDISGGFQTVKLNFSNLASAVYIIKVIAPDGNILTKQKVIK
ncbi:MAG TPA: T9SS type A sorting domain-containing protein, partial [Chitinophagaceae bacterium]|nr:T9SS type A sorting domain-containing protein [Chitinophagaceae bacterium]